MQPYRNLLANIWYIRQMGCQPATQPGGSHDQPPHTGSWRRERFQKSGVYCQSSQPMSPSTHLLKGRTHTTSTAFCTGSAGQIPKPVAPDGQSPNAVSHAMGAFGYVNCYARLEMPTGAFLQHQRVALLMDSLLMTSLLMGALSSLTEGPPQSICLLQNLLSLFNRNQPSHGWHPGLWTRLSRFIAVLATY